MQPGLAGNALRSWPIGRLLRHYYGAAVVGLLVTSLYNIVDRIFIGRFVGPYALSALGAVYPVLLIIMALGMLVGIGGAVRISICLGRNDTEDAQRVLGHGLWLMVALGLTVMVSSIWLLTPLLHSLGTTPRTEQYAADYLFINLLGAVFNIVGHSGNGYLRAQGSVRVAMVSMIISGVANVALDALFVIHFQWGVKGAAWATVLSQALLCVWVMAHFMRKDAVVRFNWRYFRFNWASIWAIVTIGFSPFIMQVSASILQGVLNVQLLTYGNEFSQSTLAVVNATAQMLGMGIIALNQAAQPIWGYCHGAREHQRLLRCLRYCLITGTLIATVGSTTVILLAKRLLQLFSEGESGVVSTGNIHGLRLYFSAYALAGAQIVAFGYFQSVGKAAISALLATSRRLLLLLPFLFILPITMGIKGVWLSIPIADTLAFLLSAGFLIREIVLRKRRIQEEKETTLPQPNDGPPVSQPLPCGY